LLEKRKDLWASWSVNICQLVDMKRLDEAFELAKKATERFPLTSQVWYDLSLVHKVKGESEEQIKALKQAISINPNWSYAIQQLTEAYMRTERNQDAQTLLEESIRKMPLDQFLHGYLADVLWQLGAKENAVEIVKKALKLDAEYEWAWHALKKWLRELNKSDEVEKMAWQMASAKPRDVNSWLTLAKILDEENQAEKQFEAINQVLSIDPFNIRGLGLKVRNLINRELYDKALRVCQTRLPDGHQPELLRYYAAQIELERKNFPLAVQMFEDLVKFAPHFYIAWERLAEIYREVESKAADYLRVTKAMTQVAPNDSIVFGYYGEACLFNEKRAEAKIAFRQAVALAPDYEFAASVLFDLHFEDKERNETLSTLQTLKQFVKGPATILRELRFNLAENNKDDVKRLWSELCLDATSNRKHFDKAIQSITISKLFHAKEKFIEFSLKEFLKLPAANENLGEIWIENYWQKLGPKKTKKSIEEMSIGSVAWRKAVRTYLELLRKGGKNFQIRFLIEDLAKSLKSDNEIWASSGFYLYSIKEDKKVVEWFSDWQTRQNVQPWMLWNYALSLHRLGKTGDAHLVHQTVVNNVKVGAADNYEQDDTLQLHLIMLGLENLKQGNLSVAKKFAQKVNLTYLQEWGKYFHFLLTTTLNTIEFSNRDTQKRDKLIKEMVDVSLSYQDLWSNKIMRNNFQSSLNKVLELNLTKWAKTKVQMRIWGSYISYLLNKK
jgi:cellulose synthase operon protein C